MFEISNPVYEEIPEEEDNNMDSHEKIPKKELFEEFHKTEELFAKLIRKYKRDTVEIATLNPGRYNATTGRASVSDKPASIAAVKMAGLELSMNTDENEVSRMEKFTVHYMNYFAFLGLPDNVEEFNYDYVDSLCKESDVNRKDIHGQSVIHEIAREWHIDVCSFLKSRGVDIDVEDQWGRTPLFVAVASNNVPMLKWLIQQGADMNHRTIKGEGQLPIHYATKFDAVEAFEALMELGSDPLIRDHRDRTPFFLAAEAGNTRMCKVLLDIDLPVASYDNNAVSIIDHVVTNLPTPLATKALDQFISVSKMDTSLVKVYLSCLGKRRWSLLQQRKSVSREVRLVMPPDSLDIITEKNDLELITHPVIIQYIKTKRERFGNRFIWINNLINLIFTVLWTASAVYSSGNISIIKRITLRDKNSVLLLTLAAQIVTIFFIYKLFLEWKVSRKFILDEKRRRRAQLYNSEEFCHPRWPGDMSTQEKDVETVNNLESQFWKDGWTIIEVVCLFLGCVKTIITIYWYINPEGTKEHYTRLYYSAFFVLVVWIRLNRCFKYHQTLGPFVEMLQECALASTRIGFLFFEFVIPFAVAFWVFFGGVAVKGGSTEYLNFNDLLYQLWLLAFIGDYELDTLLKVERLLAQVLVGIYLVVVSIITINIYIALLSEAYSRVIATSSHRSYMAEASIYTNIERIFPSIKEDFEIFLNKYCAPLTMDRKRFLGSGHTFNTREVVSNVAKTTQHLKNSLKKIGEDELGMKRDVEEMERILEEFHSKYDGETTKKLISRVNEIINDKSIMGSHIPSVMKRADVLLEHMKSFRSKLEDLYYYHVTEN